jgi:adenylate cyclase
VLDVFPEAILVSAKSRRIRQGYRVCQTAREIWIRDNAGQYFMTVKQGTGLKWQELEIGIDNLQFDALWPQTEGSRVEKERYHLSMSGVLPEIDVFAGGLAPLTMVEVEFDNEAASTAFTVPAFCTREVTYEADNKNVCLAQNGLPLV